MNKIFAIGDIHGCYRKLCVLMGKIPIDKDQDILVFLGDYIDRGDNSYDVIEYLISLNSIFRKLVLLKGNHEEMFENYLSDKDKYSFLLNGGYQTLESYFQHAHSKDDSLVPNAHSNFIKSLDLFYETEYYIFVHAGLRDGVPISMQEPSDLLWLRYSFLRSDFDFGKQVVFGHTPFAEPLVQRNKIGIDTGAVYGNKLTCVELPELRFYQA